MKLYGEERTPVAEGYNLIARAISNIEEGIENILQMPNFALWSIAERTDLSALHAIRDKQMGGNTSMVPGFRPYLSDSTNRIPGGFIVIPDIVYYCPKAIGLNGDRESYTMIHPDGNNFYTTFKIDDILRIVLSNNRTLRRANFTFANKPILDISDPLDVEEFLGCPPL